MKLPDFIGIELEELNVQTQKNVRSHGQLFPSAIFISGDNGDGERKLVRGEPMDVYRYEFYKTFGDQIIYVMRVPENYDSIKRISELRQGRDTAE